MSDGEWSLATGATDYYGTGGWLEADADRGFSRLRIMRLAD